MLSFLRIRGRAPTNAKHYCTTPDFNCVSVAHPWESGMDNCPAWDGPMSRIDPTRAPYFERRDKGKVTNAAQRPTDGAYFYLLRHYSVPLVCVCDAQSMLLAHINVT